MVHELSAIVRVTRRNAVGLSEVQFQGTPVAVPEPTSLMLFAIAAAGIGRRARRRRHQAHMAP
jgi:hypothetical protein